ncbi:TPA: hypothetical protein DDY55_00590 [Candidatus Falkowbacteria bacterium]|nr:hypothetical protein [Candidatus Falkowbacteria bacterium]HAY12346.1 hypothetical protein [Candidatus Falkowbacteria bacterium]HBI96604.1 hypothetical protein [Candidatus Falkowbacteria bacterium]HBT27745.1 hypothetical protein [Candidatus Falkowbacteria bacterium]HBY15170.1 hypothetical protein [Candidatus Falkowbacteria bacterium]
MPNFTEIILDRKFSKILLLLLLLIFSGCSISQKKSTSNSNWQNEVLLADECGYDGLKCCEDKDQPCKYGQNCCVNPGNDKDNYCSESCELGKEKSFCRSSDPSCDFGLVCHSDRCLTCGNENQLCCQGQNECADNLFCFNEKCVTCGQVGNPCCPGAEACQRPENTDRRSECSNGVCRDCGYSSGAACLSEPFCIPGNLHNNDSCYRCGGLNQPCCSTEKNADACDQKENLECLSGFCINK